MQPPDRLDEDKEREERAACICEPCESPARGHPGIAHCAACCAGSMIESYNHDCPIDGHQELAVAQWGEQSEPDYEQITEDRAYMRGPDPEAVMWGGEDIPS